MAAPAQSIQIVCIASAILALFLLLAAFRHMTHVIQLGRPVHEALKKECSALKFQAENMDNHRSSLYSASSNHQHRVHLRDFCYWFEISSMASPSVAILALLQLSVSAALFLMTWQTVFEESRKRFISFLQSSLYLVLAVISGMILMGLFSVMFSLEDQNCNKDFKDNYKFLMVELEGQNYLRPITHPWQAQAQAQAEADHKFDIDPALCSQHNFVRLPSPLVTARGGISLQEEFEHQRGIYKWFLGFFITNTLFLLSSSIVTFVMKRVEDKYYIPQYSLIKSL